VDQLRDNIEVGLKFYAVTTGIALGQRTVAGSFENDNECCVMCQSKDCHIIQQDYASLFS